MLAVHHRVQAGLNTKKMERTLSGLLGDVEKVVRVNHKSPQTITFGYVKFRVSKKQLILVHGSEVHTDGSGSIYDNFFLFLSQCLPMS